MSPTLELEDRLRAHFAEQTARDVLETPDPRTVMAAASLPPRRPSSGRRQTVRLTVVAALAAACVLAVVAVAATHDQDKTTVSDDPTTTEPRPSTTVPDAGASTTVPETTTTVGGVAGAQSVVVAPLGVLGWWDGQGWVQAERGRPVPLQGGEQYRLTRIGSSITTVTGPAPAADSCAIDVGLPVVHLDGFGDASTINPETLIGVTGVDDIQPRPVTVLDPAGYRDEAVAALASQGIDDPAAEPRRVVRTDLDGDGSDEVLMQVERVADYGTLLPEAGDYSAVFLRQVVGGEVRTFPVEQFVADMSGDGFGYILVFDVVAIADLNGDGRMEVVLDQRYYEGSSTVAYELDDPGSLTQVIGVGCGS